MIDRVERVCIALNYRGPFLANPINLLTASFFLSLFFVFFVRFCLFVCWFVFIVCSGFVFCLFNSFGGWILFSAEHSTYINLLPLSIGPDIVVYQEYFLHFFNFLFVLFCFVWFLFPFCFVLCVLLRIFLFVYLYFIVYCFFLFVFVLFLFLFAFYLLYCSF